MRFIHLYLVGYFVLVIGTASPCRPASFNGSPRPWVAIAALLVIGLGIILAATSARPTITRD